MLQPLRGPAIRGASVVALALGRRCGRERDAAASAALQIIYPKNRQLWVTNSLNDVTRWNSHSYVLVQRPR